MLDINLIRENPEKVKKALLKRMEEIDFEELLEKDKKRKNLLYQSEKLRKKKNEVSRKIAKCKQQGREKEARELIKEMGNVAETIKDLDSRLRDVEEKIKSFMEKLPNIPENDVPAGGKENNQVIKKWGQKPDFSFEIKDHKEILEKLNMIDYKRGAKLGGNGFWIYKCRGALLEWSLINFFVNEHLKDGFQMLLPPHILTEKCGYTAGQFPKFKDDVFHLEGQDNKGYGQFLIPTAETALVNLHRDEILTEDELPIKYFSITPCYRREAGSYRSNERGTIRGHQFNKVELFMITRPENSTAALEELTKKAENLVQKLGLHYQVSKLAAGDCSAAMAKTLDIEAWIPSMNEYKEVSSISNAHDYQARRGDIKYRRKKSKVTEYVHTLNASGLATSRLLPAIAEQFQREDGSFVIPDILDKNPEHKFD